MPAGPPHGGPYPPAQPRRKKSSGSTVGAIVGVLVVLAAAVGAAFYFLSEDDPPPTQYGDTCFVTDGSCPLAQGSLPLGTSCTCFDGFGAQYSGTVG